MMRRSKEWTAKMAKPPVKADMFRKKTLLFAELFAIHRANLPPIEGSNSPIFSAPCS